MKKILVKLIRLYQLAISPFIAPCCRYSPSCSAYSQEAIEKYGVMKGCMLSLKRLGRCHPFHHGGYDPVP